MPPPVDVQSLALAALLGLLGLLAFLFLRKGACRCSYHTGSRVRSLLAAP
jgi:hypothetical protein